MVIGSRGNDALICKMIRRQLCWEAKGQSADHDGMITTSSLRHAGMMDMIAVQERHLAMRTLLLRLWRHHDFGGCQVRMLAPSIADQCFRILMLSALTKSSGTVLCGCMEGM